MGKPLMTLLNDPELNKIAQAAFLDEITSMEKQAFIGSLIKKLTGPRVLVKSFLESGREIPGTLAGEAGKFVNQLNPIHGIPEGYRALGGQYAPHMEKLRHDLMGQYGLLEKKLPEKSMVDKFWEKVTGKGPDAVPISLQEAKETGKLLGPEELKQKIDLFHSAQAAQKSGTPLTPEMEQALQQGGKGPGLWSKNFGAASQQHLLEDPKGLLNTIRGKGLDKNRVQAIAEELSRSGWTGGGKITKYLPVGQKGMMAGFGAQAFPQVIEGAQQGNVGPTGEGGAFEKGLGFAGSNAGWLLGAPLGMIGSSAMWLGGEHAGKSLGRIVDRMRGGANLPTAALAPTPTEAQDQLSRIQQYYGQPAPEQYPTKGVVNG